MKDRRIGVWASVALVIFVLSAWLGSKLGARVAVSRYRSAQHRGLGSLSAPEHAHLELVLDELQAIGLFRMTLLASTNHEKLRKALPEQVGKFEEFGRHLNTGEAKPVFDMNLAFAKVAAAIVDEQSGNDERAASQMRSAQTLLQSLGWSEYSEGTLRALAQRQLNEWSLKPQGSESPK
jgi:hypothetical protein